MFLSCLVHPSSLLTGSFPQVKEAAEKEWDAFKTERTLGVEEISQLRQRVAEEQERKKAERLSRAELDADKEMVPSDQPAPVKKEDVQMDVDDTAATETKTKEDIATKEAPAEPELKEEPTAMQADDDDAVEY